MGAERGEVLGAAEGGRRRRRGELQRL